MGSLSLVSGSQQEFYLGFRLSGASPLITLAGTPAGTTLSPKLLVTTEPLATTTLLPKVTLGLMTACPPIQRSFPIERGAPNSRSERLVSMSSGWVAAYSPTFGLGGMVRESSGELNCPLRLQVSSVHRTFGPSLRGLVDKMDQLELRLLKRSLTAEFGAFFLR